MPPRLPSPAMLPRRAPRCLQGAPRCLQGASRRAIHTSKQRPGPPIPANDYAERPASRASGASPKTAPAPLSVLPLSTVVRSLLTTTVSSSPLLLGPSLACMTALAHSRRALLDPDRNALLRWLLKTTFYAQFCAGETPDEVRRTIDGLKRIGFDGVILGYAKEVVVADDEKRALAALPADAAPAPEAAGEIQAWADGTLETIRLAEPGDFVAVKFTGAGRQALRDLTQQRPPSPALAAAVDGICQLAVARGVRLLFDAENQAVQAGIDDWTLRYMRAYNTRDRAVVHGTYQAYLKATGAVLSRHLRAAQAGGFALGVKLVRGAYLGSDPRAAIHDTKQDTDAAYDGIAEALLRREWRRPLESPAEGQAPFPEVRLVLATHNADSVRRAQAILAATPAAAAADVAMGQLQGMADEVSCQLLCDARRLQAEAASAGTGPESSARRPFQTVKYLVWGSTGECMKYLLRRAHENRDAVQRTRSSRDAMLGELLRRARAFFHWA